LERVKAEKKKSERKLPGESKFSAFHDNRTEGLSKKKSRLKAG